MNSVIWLLSKCLKVKTLHTRSSLGRVDIIDEEGTRYYGLITMRVWNEVENSIKEVGRFGVSRIVNLTMVIVHIDYVDADMKCGHWSTTMPFNTHYMQNALDQFKEFADENVNTITYSDESLELNQ